MNRLLSRLAEVAVTALQLATAIIALKTVRETRKKHKRK